MQHQPFPSPLHTDAPLARDRDDDDDKVVAATALRKFLVLHDAIVSKVDRRIVDGTS